MLGVLNHGKQTKNCLNTFLAYDSTIYCTFLSPEDFGQLCGPAVHVDWTNAEGTMKQSHDTCFTTCQTKAKYDQLTMPIWLHDCPSEGVVIERIKQIIDQTRLSGWEEDEAWLQYFQGAFTLMWRKMNDSHVWWVIVGLICAVLFWSSISDTKLRKTVECNERVLHFTVCVYKRPCSELSIVTSTKQLKG